MKTETTYTDGRKVVTTAAPKDYVAFERQYNLPMGVFSDDGVATRIEWIYYLAWSPLHRAKQEPRAFDEFLDDVLDVDVIVDGPVDATPFPPAPSGETSSG